MKKNLIQRIPDEKDLPPILPPRPPKPDEIELPPRPPKPKEKLPPKNYTLARENDDKEDIFWTFSRLKEEFPNKDNPLLPQEKEEALPLKPKDHMAKEDNNMIENIKKFLDKANTRRPHVREEIQLENYQREQIVPRGIQFWYMCRMYRHKIHYCKEMGKYYNIDYSNLILIEGDTPEEVEAKHEGGKALNFLIVYKR